MHSFSGMTRVVFQKAYIVSCQKLESLENLELYPANVDIPTVRRRKCFHIFGLWDYPWVACFEISNPSNYYETYVFSLKTYQAVGFCVWFIYAFTDMVFIQHKKIKNFILKILQISNLCTYNLRIIYS